MTDQSSMDSNSTEERTLQQSLDKSTPSDVVYVEFEPHDKENPLSFSTSRKWLITICATAFTSLTALYVGTIETAADSMQRDLSATPLQVSATLSTYALGFAIVPLFTASFSEEFGRRPLYIISAFVFFIMHVAVGLAKNIQSVMVFRFFAGAAGSTGATMVGGTVADIWHTNQRGFPMALFAFAALGSTGLGPAATGYIALNPRLEWRWIQWISAIVSGVYLIIALFVMVETRADVILTRRARSLRKKTGDQRYKAGAEEEKTSLRKLIYISCTRPILLLLTEPTVIAFSLWIGFAWGILFGQLGSIELVFSSLHGFNIGQIGLVDLSLFIGALLGLVAQYWQEKMYQRYHKKKGHEARLYAACIAAFLFPIGCFIYAWTLESRIPWIAPCIGLAVFNFAVYAIFLATFAYLADVYQIYASSALAGQSMCRNLSAMAFPLFTKQMYARLTVKWSNTLFGCLAVLLAPVPIVLYFWGPKIRSRSKYAKLIEAWQERQSSAKARLPIEGSSIQSESPDTDNVKSEEGIQKDAFELRSDVV